MIGKSQCKERRVINAKRDVRWGLAGLLLVVLISAVACRGKSEEVAEPTSIPMTSTPAPTALPPLPTLPPLGSEANPIVMLFVTPEPSEMLSAAQELAEELSSGEAIIEVRLTESYAEAYYALCDGSAHVVSLNAFASLAALESECGDLTYVVEMDGVLATQGQVITALQRNVFTVLNFRGRDYCRPDANSVHGWIIPSLVMRTYGIDPLRDLTNIVDSGSDEGVVNGVFMRDCDTGGTILGVEEGIRNPNPAFSDRIYVIPETLPPVPNDTVVLTTKVDENAQAFLLDLLFQGESELQDLLDADTLVIVDDDIFFEIFDPLIDLLEDAGVSAAALAE